MLPTLLTIGNLILGFVAIAVIVLPDAFGLSQPRLEAAVWLIVAAGALDAVDGPLARLGGRAPTPWGLELDALADLVSFTVAPVVLIGVAAPPAARGVVTAAGALFILAGAWRLSRFIWAGGTVTDGRFSGLPSTAAGLTVAAFWLFESRHFGALVHLESGLVLMGLLAGCMVSRIGYEKFPELGRTDPRNRLKWVVAAGAIVVIACDPPRAGLAVALLYTAHGPIAALIRSFRSTRKRPGSEGES